MRSGYDEAQGMKLEAKKAHISLEKRYRANERVVGEEGKKRVIFD